MDNLIPSSGVLPVHVHCFGEPQSTVAYEEGHSAEPKSGKELAGEEQGTTITNRVGGRDEQAN